MRQHLLVELHPPSGDYIVSVESSAFRVDASGYPPALRDALNLALEGIRLAHPDAKLFQSFPKTVQRLRSLDETVAGHPVSDRSLSLYFRVSLPPQTAPAAVTLAAHALTHSSLLAPIVKRVTVLGGFRPACDGTQGYVGTRSAGGLNIDPARRLPGGHGSFIDPATGTLSRVTVCVVDVGFNPAQIHLPRSPRLDYALPIPLAPASDHGTYVLGVLASVPAMAPVGIAHDALFRVACTIRSSSHQPVRLLGRSLDPATPVDARDVLYALDDAVAGVPLVTGDVVVIEKQTTDLKPVEINDDIRQFFWELTTLGITVVEPAGNNNLDLNGLAIQPRSGTGTESGAILVGAGSVETGPTAKAALGSNHGHRVDCQAWGECVLTLEDYWDAIPGTTAPGEQAWFKDDFGGTSAAAAIVGGMVALIQSIQRSAGRAFLDPLTIRTALGNPANGQLPASAVTAPIGPEPDLLLVLKKLDLVPDVFLRDTLADDGTEPSASDDVWASPDIIPRRTRLNNPAELADWADGSLADVLASGVENYIYLRADNRGPFDDDVTFFIYWAYPGTFLDPADWQPVGMLRSVIPGTVTGGTQTVVGPIAWTPPADVAQPALIVVAQSAAEPGPVLGAASTASEYISSLRRYNNLAQRNVLELELPEGLAIARVNVEVPAGGRPDPTSVSVTANGAPPGTRIFVGMPPNREAEVLPDWQARTVNIKTLLEEVAGGSGRRSHAAFQASLGQLAGDRRAMGQAPRAWLVHDAGQPLRLQGLASAAAHSLPLIIGVKAPRRARAFTVDAAFTVDVVQRLGSRPVGHVHMVLRRRPRLSLRLSRPWSPFR